MSWRHGFCGAALLWCFMGSAHAQAVYLELGTALSVEEAERNWQVLRTTYPSLAKLSFAAKPKAMTGKEPVYRLQAGPVRDKAAAYRLCGQLLAKDAECFVVQTTPDQPAARNEEITLAQLPKESQPVPTAAKAEEAAAPEGNAPAQPVRQVVPRAVAMPWMNASENPVKAVIPPPQEKGPPTSLEPEKTGETSQVPWDVARKLPNVDAAPAGEGEVAVAEAIRVPVTVDESARAPVVAQIPPQAIAKGERSNVAGVSIGYFAGENAAMDFWNALKLRMPELSVLRARMHTPYQQRAVAARVMLIIEPVSDASTAAGICGFANQYAAGLSCNPRQAQQSSAFPRGPRFHSYRLINASGMSRDEALSLQNPERMNVLPRPRGLAVRPKGAQMAYWVQLGSGSSRKAAQQQWDELRLMLPKLLGKYEAFVSTPPATNGTYQVSYRLRTGPFQDEAGADRLCNSLQTKNVDCLVIRDF